jgi:peptide/nickel transport system substrate-binding protein
MKPRPLAGARGVVLLFVLGALTAGLVWGLATAFAASPSPAPSSPAVTLRIGWTEEPDNLNPFIGYQNETYEIWALNYDLLFGYGDRNQPTLDLASQFPTRANGGISADGLTWTIKIRSGVKWQDGQPLTADDVAFTFNYIVKNQMANFTNSTFGIKSARALDPTTVQIVCSQPKADLESMWVPIIPKHIWEHVTPNAAQTSYAVKLPLVGSGPFRTVEFKKGNYIHLVANPGYWGPKPAIHDIYFQVYQDADTMVTDLKAGNIDAAWGLPQAQFSALKSDSAFKAVPYSYYNWNYLEFNSYASSSSLGNPVLRDWRFRNALNYAVDKQRLAQLAYDGYAAPATTIIPPGVWTNPDYHWQPPADQTYTFDLAHAGQLLDQAGYRLGSAGARLDRKGKPIKLRLYASTDSSQEQSEAKLITGWLDRLGLKITLSVIDPGTLTSDIYNAHGTAWAPDYDLVVWNWTGYFDPGQTLVCFTTPQIGSLDEPYWSSTRYDALNAQQAALIDPQARKVPIWQMQQLMYQQTPWVVLTYPDYLEAYNTTRWTGWQQMFGGSGPAFNAEGFIGSYLHLRPQTASSSSGGSHRTVLIASVVVVVAAVVIAIVLVRRRRPQAEED